ncbi:glycoprotein A33 (transmembrane), paralog a [Garra rufa]|uniref:glycoprotein A33 (transmembrane), paralog a n=1 Tax=Garra rufa TaxID=137080 RepID=UPI003CCE82F4
MAGTLGIFGICLLFAGVHLTSGFTVNIPDKVYKIARGDNVTVPCTFTPPAAGSSVLVSWTAAADAADDPEVSIVSYFGPSQITVYKKYKGRANLQHDIPKGIANLQLQRVTSADTRVYECKVEIPGDEEGSLSDTASVVVLVAPSTPICNIVGAAEYFKDIQLTCRSEEGTPAPVYKWQSYHVNNIPRPMPLKATEQNGVLSLVNITKETSGYYICTSTNEIRSAKCNVTLAVMPPSLTLGTTGTAAIIAVVLAVALLVGIVVCCCYCRRRKEKNEEYAMGTPEGGEFTDKDPEGREDGHDEHVNYEEEQSVKSADRREPQDDRSERSYDRRNDNDDRRDRDDRYADRRDDRSERRDRDVRDDRDDRYDDRRDRYDDRRDRYDDRRDRYDDRRDRYDSDRYSDRYDSRDRPPSVPPNKPKEPRN